MSRPTHDRSLDDIPPLTDWMEIARLILAAPHASDEVDVLLALFEQGRLPLEALEHSLRALAVKH